MMDWRRPPAGISPERFFTGWLPEAFEHSGREASLAAPLVRASLSGSDGGAWDAQGSGRVLTVGPASDARPGVWVRQTVADFRAALEGDTDLPELIPATWSALDMLFLDPRDLELLRQVQGRVSLELAGRRRRRWVLDVAFGDDGIKAGRPRTTVRIDAATFEGVRDGVIAPLQPLLDGRLRLEGDRALGMRLLLLLGSRLARR